MKRYYVWMMLIPIWMGSAGFGPDAAQTYSKAGEFAETGQADFAFMYYNDLLRNYPASRYRGQTLFAVGEYYFRIFGYQDAEMVFKEFISEYPDSKEKLYALAYLLNIARRNQDALTAQVLEKKIIDLQQVSFVFRKTKEFTYRSPLYQNYKAVIHIDKIEFYVEGELFAKVSY